MGKNDTQKRIIARIFGNFGTAFFGTLLSANVADSLFDSTMSFMESLVVAAMAAIFTTGTIMFREIKEYGYKK